MQRRQVIVAATTAAFMGATWVVSGMLTEQEPPTLGTSVVVVRDSTSSDPVPSPSSTSVGAERVLPPSVPQTSASASTSVGSTASPAPTSTAPPAVVPPPAPPPAPPAPPPADDDADDDGDDDADDDPDDDADDPDDDDPDDD